MPYTYLTTYQAQEILDAVKKNLKSLNLSFDTGKSIQNVSIEYFEAENKVVLNNIVISISDLKRIIKNKESVFVIDNNTIEKVQSFSDLTKKFVKLTPIAKDTAPVMEISGVRMHNLVGADQNPLRDTQMKVSSLDIHNSNVLEIGFGLGYSSIELLKLGNKVVTYEVDPVVVEVAKLNPWSTEAFDMPNHDIKIGDVFNEIKALKEGYYDGIFHDPPRFKNAPELYSPTFYKDLYRVLKNSGKLYHYIGRHRDEFEGKDIFNKIKNQLSEAGFRNVKEAYLGYTAKKN